MIHVIYHGNCADGFTSAWIMNKYLPYAQFWPVDYGQPIPFEPMADDLVWIVDFSYPRQSLIDLANQVCQVVVLDHHLSAKLDLEGLDHPLIKIVFDMNRSGAGITYDWCYQNFIEEKPDLFKHYPSRPHLVNYVQDRDLWKFELPYSRPLNAYIFSFEYSFENWDYIFAMLEQEIFRAAATEQGRAIERKHFKDINELIAKNKTLMKIAGHPVPVLNCPYMWSSDAAHIMAGMYDTDSFAACYVDGPALRVWSLRSTETGMDVSIIAKQFGGGGHKHAAGFKTNLNWRGDVET